MGQHILSKIPEKTDSDIYHFFIYKTNAIYSQYDCISQIDLH